MNTLFVLQQFGIVLLTAAFTLVCNSLLEWYLHACVLHDTEETEVAQSHGEHHSQSEKGGYKSSGHEEGSFGLSGLTLIKLVFIMGALGYLLSKHFSQPAIFLTAVPITAFYFWALGYVHKHVHVPTGGWFERTRLYQILDRHHHVHHARDDRNYSILSPFIADWLLRTLHNPKKQKTVTQ